MEIKTKYDAGMVLCRIEDSKASTFVVKKIVYSDGSVSYGEGLYDQTPEDQCFISMDELSRYVFGE